MNQMNQLNQQQNRYLESPYVIRDTNPEEQFVFGTVINFVGGIIFREDSFSIPTSDIGQELGNELEDNSDEMNNKTKEWLHSNSRS